MARIIRQKLSTWAQAQGVAYRTAWDWVKHDRMPENVEVERLPSGSIFVLVESDENMKNVIYVRTLEKWAETQREQCERVQQWCAHNNIPVDDIVCETGSGLLDRRPKLGKLLADFNINLIAENRHRVATWGFDAIETVMKASGRRIMLLDDSVGFAPGDEARLDAVLVTTRYLEDDYGRQAAARLTREVFQEI